MIEAVQDEQAGLLTLEQAAARLSIGQSTLRRWADRRLIASVKLAGKPIRFLPDDLDAFVRRHRRPAAIEG